VIGAELTKLLRRRSNLAIIGVFLVLIPIVIVVIVQIVHASNSAGHGPVGDPDNAQGLLNSIGILAAIVALAIGARVGTQDVSSGVFRDLVSTGASRVRIWAVRIPAALGVVLGATAIALAIVVGVSEATKSHGANPFETNGNLLKAVLVTAAYAAVYTLLALGLGALFGSMAAATVVLFAYLFVLSTIFSGVGFNVSGFHFLVYFDLSNDIGRWWPWADEQAKSVSSSLALLALVLAIGGTTALGAWRTVTRDA
jgi:hypothetical protein